MTGSILGVVFGGPAGPAWLWVPVPAAFWQRVLLPGAFAVSSPPPHDLGTPPLWSGWGPCHLTPSAFCAGFRGPPPQQKLVLSAVPEARGPNRNVGRAAPSRRPPGEDASLRLQRHSSLCLRPRVAIVPLCLCLLMPATHVFSRRRMADGQPPCAQGRWPALQTDRSCGSS